MLVNLKKMSQVIKKGMRMRFCSFFIVVLCGWLGLMPLSYARTVYPYAASLCQEEGYSCVRVKRNQSWGSLFSDHYDRSIVMRINRMNINLWPGMVIAVPNHLSTANIIDFSPFPLSMQSSEKVVVVDPNVQAWAAYDHGQLLRWGPISAGSDYCRDIHAPCRTHEGVFRIFSLGNSDCYSKRFPLPDGGAPMPYCMFFNNGQALHGEARGLPGYNDSHGCVRMYVDDAEWLRYEFAEGPTAQNHYRGTKVVVRSYGYDIPVQDDFDQRPFDEGSEI